VVSSGVFRVEPAVFGKGQQVAAGGSNGEPFDGLGADDIARQVIANGQIAEADEGAVLDEGRDGQANVVNAVVVVDEGARLPLDGEFLVQVAGFTALSACSSRGSVQPLFGDIVDAIAMDPVELERNEQLFKECKAVGE